MKQKILVICANNSARSQIAEGFLKKYYRDKFEVFSAGIKPTKINQYAIKVMEEIGIDISNQYSKSIVKFRNIKFDYVITVCNKTKEICPFFPGKNILHKNFKDPSESEGNKKDILENFRIIRNQIKEWVINIFK